MQAIYLALIALKKLILICVPQPRDLDGALLARRNNRWGAEQFARHPLALNQVFVRVIYN